MHIYMYISYFTAMGGASFSQPWRSMPWTNEENLNFIKSYKPQNNDVENLRILLHGPVGAGKSSFINSLESVLLGRVTGRVMTDTISANSFTKKYKAFKIHKDPESFYPFIFNDTMGFEQRNGMNVEDIKLALMGHVTEGYKPIPGVQLKESDQEYNSCPSLDDKVHALVCVMPADLVSLISDEVVKKMRDVRLAASDMGIPQLAILTKVDEACPEVKNNIKNVYESIYLKEQVDKFSLMLGIPQNCIFLVKNYESELQTNEDINGPILIALRQMIVYGEDFINNL
ncbi:interferon-induced protein 44-like isoform X1 [Cottoperca gobio]|uniref:Interferon-induced protein 44-like isoform X1 n=2 Tax=Cottoperca gobio TaxID=56716 RepID=A0A6J2Q6Q5_COTGO|nr:interferon-induced protein 44-like isoform X1 [Cottoperca gobio]